MFERLQQSDADCDVYFDAIARTKYAQIFTTLLPATSSTAKSEPLSEEADSASDSKQGDQTPVLRVVDVAVRRGCSRQVIEISLERRAL